MRPTPLAQVIYCTWMEEHAFFPINHMTKYIFEHMGSINALDLDPPSLPKQLCCECSSDNLCLIIVHILLNFIMFCGI